MSEQQFPVVGPYTLTEKEKVDYWSAKQSGDLKGFWLQLAATHKFSYYGCGTDEFPSLGSDATFDVFYTKTSEPKPTPAADLFSSAQSNEPAPVTDSPATEEEPKATPIPEPSQTTGGIKLYSLRSENYKKLNIEIMAEGRGFEIVGENGIGKSSIIDAIYTTLQGMRGNTTEKPIQTGAESAKNEVSLILERDFEVNGRTLTAGTEIVAIRRFTAAGNTLTVKVDGKNAPSPAELMKWLVGEVAISDPTDLWGMKEIDRKKYLTMISGIADELAKIEAEKKIRYDKKYEVEQEISRLEKDLEEFADVPEVVQESDLSTIQKDIEARQAKHAEGVEQRKVVDTHVLGVGRAKEQLAEYDKTIDSIKTSTANTYVEIDDLKRKIVELENKIEGNNQQIEFQEREKQKYQQDVLLMESDLKKEERMLQKIADEYTALPDRTEELKNLQEANKLFIRGQQRDTFRKRLQAERDRQDQVMQSIADIEDQRKRLFESAELPIPHLEIKEDGVYYKGVPLTKDQISEAEGLELCMDILIAQKPNLKLISFKTGHALSNSTLNRVLQKAKYQDYQIIIEKVADNTDIQIEFFENKP